MAQKMYRCNVRTLISAIMGDMFQVKEGRISIDSKERKRSEVVQISVEIFHDLGVQLCRLCRETRLISLIVLTCEISRKIRLKNFSSSKRLCNFLLPNSRLISMVQEKQNEKKINYKMLNLTSFNGG